MHPLELEVPNTVASAYYPTVAEQVLAAIEPPAEEVTEIEEFISNEEYRDLLTLAINDAEVWISQAKRLLNLRF
jgi:hypothetical protein